MKVIIPGGSGHVGQSLAPYLEACGHEVRVVSRSGEHRWVIGDPDTVVRHLDWADAIINLAGRTVNCRYNRANLEEMMRSRVDSVQTISDALTDCAYPPSVWLQASTATIYSHRLDAPNDETIGIIDPTTGPSKWRASEQIAIAWESALFEKDHSGVRKVALRSAMTMSPVPGSVFDVMSTLARRGLLGTFGSGEQYVSWIHDTDFCRSIKFLLENETISGPINLCSPNPLPNREFNRILRQSVGAKVGFPTPAWALEIGAWAMRTETELILKSRRVVPTRLLELGFKFNFPTWPEAASDLAKKLSAKR